MSTAQRIFPEPKKLLVHEGWVPEMPVRSVELEDGQSLTSKHPDTRREDVPWVPRGLPQRGVAGPRDLRNREGVHRGSRGDLHGVGGEPRAEATCDIFVGSVTPIPIFLFFLFVNTQ